MNRIVLLVILNASVGFILKSFLVFRPIFTSYYQTKCLIYNTIIQLSYIRTCQSDFVCSTIDTIGRNFFLVNLTITFFFFYKFDSRFNECFKVLVENLKKRLKQKIKNSKLNINQTQT